MAERTVSNARDLLARHGRHGDTELAHISRGERNLMRAWQGHEDINPVTGLPEYFSFKKLLKGVAKAAGAIAGGAVAGPAGAAVGGALATKLTGGSWKSALGTGLLSGISAYGLQQSGAGDWMGIGALGKNADLLGRVGETAASGAAGAAGAGASGGLDFKKLLPVAALGIGALGGATKQPKMVSTAPQAVQSGETWETTTKPLDRKYRRYGDDYYTYGQDAGAHEFYDEVNPPGYAHGGIARFAEGGGAGSGTRDRSPSGPGRPGGAAGPGGKGPDKAMQDKIKAAYEHLNKAGLPSRQFDTQQNAKTVSGIMDKGDPTTLGGMMNRRPSTLSGWGRIISGEGTPTDAANAVGQGIGMVGGAPLGVGMNIGTGMGSAVKDVQTLRDMGLLGGTTRTDPVMGRVDTIDGESYSMGNPATADRFGESIGPGRTAPGHSGGGDGAKVLSALTQTFTPPPTEGAPAGGSDMPAAPVNTGIGQWRDRRSPEDYYTYGERPEWEFFNQVNPVTSAATGGTIKGAGSGQSDEIPALLSDNEHVIDAATVAALGDGSSDEGHRRIEKLKAMIRKQAGYKNTKSIPKQQRGIGSMLKEATR